MLSHDSVTRTSPDIHTYPPGDSQHKEKPDIAQTPPVEENTVTQRLPPDSHFKKRPPSLNVPTSTDSPLDGGKADPEAALPKAVLHRIPNEGWEAFKRAIEEANQRPIDKTELAKLFNELDLVNLRTLRKKGTIKSAEAMFRQFEDPSRFAKMCNALGIHQKNLEELDKHYLSRWCEALGMRPEDHSAQAKAQRISGFLLQASKLPSTALQYAIVPVVGMVTHDPRNTAYASVVLAVANIIINALSYPLMTATSVHLQARNGPSVNLSKEINYQHRASIEAEKTLEKCRELEEKGAIFLKRLMEPDMLEVRQLLLGDLKHTEENLLATIAQLHDMEPVLATSLKEKMQPMQKELEELYDAGMAVFKQIEELLKVKSLVIRQTAASENQFWMRVTRPMLSAVPALFTNAPEQADTGWKSNFVIELGTHLFSSAFMSHLPKRPGGLSSSQVLLVSVGIVVASMLVQYLFLAPRDQKNKGDAKHKLNMLYGDIFNESGKAKLAAGTLLGPDDFDEKKLTALITSPAEAMLARVMAVTKQEIDQLPEEERAKVEAALEAWKTNRSNIVRGEWGALDNADTITRKAVDVAQHFSGGGLWHSAIGSNYSKDEIVDEMIRSFCRSFHFIFLGGAGANTMPRAINAIYGGASKVPLPAYLGILALSLLSAYLGASSEDVSTTYTNIRKKEPPEQQPDAWVDIRKGMFAFASKYLENKEMNNALEKANSALSAGPFLFATNILHPEPPSGEGSPHKAKS